jgi:putative phosphoserine phosphatase/1-acylglycerol-3-phosphate O-acyltransferase
MATTAMGKAGAFFDLDRTLLRGASGPLISEALTGAGLAPDRQLPGQQLLYRLYDLVGESLPVMALARGAVLMTRGWSRAAVQAVAHEVADRLVDLVAPYAPVILDEHRREGRPVVLATTTPFDLIQPFAERLGFDDVVATRYAEHGGLYTGRLEGEFVWARGKLAAVRRWADDHGVDVGASWAYSDSVYDLPLLSAVAYPHAVNADPRLAVVATLRRWPRLQLDAPPGVPKLLGLEPFDILRLLSRPELVPFARFDIAGAERIPRVGPAIVVANHRSYFDVAAVGFAISKAGRRPRSLSKKEIFDAPVLGQLARWFGQICVDRDAGGGDALADAVRALRAGELVALMPQGTIPRGEAFFDPKLVGKTGAARLAAASGAPVIPIGVWGSELVWPRSSRLPNVTNLTHPPTVRVRVGGAVQGLTGQDAVADTEAIMAAIVRLLPDEARVGRAPSDDEIRRATPPS